MKIFNRFIILRENNSSCLKCPSLEGKAIEQARAPDIEVGNFQKRCALMFMQIRVFEEPGSLMFKMKSENRNMST